MPGLSCETSIHLIYLQIKEALLTVSNSKTIAYINVYQMILAAMSPMFNLFSSCLNHPSFSIVFSSFREATHVMQAATKGAMELGNSNLQ